ncbi:hypothetical protein BKA82DRAFT_994585 [Pisolithus tinctorius]|uniref:Uncharacterized protein n=1 Tax=Pisolithus tinctorius Marx 270 TaxID=870435 RepID=A0A0C3KQV4_PISTI|nr:hypothetical protein BKA82DRAFT_994585 [Pisolithus tinctorius]KIO11892.1 hypothetical protein M404DRAFT_994585 [Pisolithus tinctorius Marx 270]
MATCLSWMNWMKHAVEIRVAIKTQKSKIDELIKQQPPVINRLSVELLSKTMFTCRKTFWRQLAAE